MPIAVRTEEELSFRPEFADLINTMFRAVVRHVNKGLITRSDVSAVCMIFPLMLMGSYHPNTTCDNFCNMIKRNWPRFQHCIRKDNAVTKHVVFEQSKTATLNDGL